MVSIGIQNRSFIEQGRPEKPVRSKELAEVFQFNNGLATKPYYMDGDAELYNEENMVKRDALKDSQVIRKAIEKFIDENNMLYGRKRVCMVEQYVRVFTKVGLVLRPDSDVEELTKMLREEFENDALASRKRYIVRQKSKDWTLADLDTP